jgi:outer membrane lipoprotein LolB
MRARLAPAARGLALALALALAGCAQPARTPAPAGVTASSWSGRLALQVEEASSQSYAAGFELRGSADAGEMKLFTPLGGTLAVLAWSPGAAVLRSSSQERRFESLEQLAAHVTGTPIPIAALFDWLAGINTAVPGWEPDLSQLAQGRLRARRVQPLPVADLRLALDR